METVNQIRSYHQVKEILIKTLLDFVGSPLFYERFFSGFPISFDLKRKRNGKTGVHASNPGIDPGARFSKVPKTFRARKAICEVANHLFWRADLLTCFQGNKKKNNREV